MLNFNTRFLLLVLATVFLSACGMFSKSPEEKINQPKVLTALSQQAYSFHKLWSASLGAFSGGSAELLSPVWDKDIGYLATQQGVISALDLNTGKSLWHKKIKQAVSAGLGADVYQLYLVTGNAELMALDKKTGDIAWKKQLQSAVLAAPVSNNLVVITHAVDGKIAGFDPSSGNNYWVHQELVPEFSIRGNAPISFVDEQWAVVALDNGKVVALRTQQGGIVWEKTINQSAANTGDAIVSDIDLPIIYSGNSFLVCAQSGTLLAFDKQTGQNLWQGNYQEGIKACALRDNSIIAITRSDEIFAHDLATGELRWNNAQLRYRKLSRPTLDDKYTYVVDAQGLMHVLALQTGSFVGRSKLGFKSTTNAPYVQTDTIYVVSDEGNIAAYQKHARADK